VYIFVMPYVKVVVTSHFVDLDIISYASRLLYHTYPLVYANCE
jgi:hypothetical protein